MMDNKLFKQALENKDLELLRTISKSDLHNHSGLGFKFKRFTSKWGDGIIQPPKTMQSINEMSEYIAGVLRPYYTTVEGYKFAIESAFHEAKDDGVTLLKMSIDCWFVNLFKNAELFANFIEDIHLQIAPNVTFIPEIGMSRNVPVAALEKIVYPLVEIGYFKSIDIYGEELHGDLNDFIPIYKRAKAQGLKLNAHAGEFSDAKFIKKTIEILEVDSIQHGISAVESDDLMKFLRDNKIFLNICPSSNLALGRVKDIKSHPIKKLYENGVPVTINSDDIMFFDKTVSEEYLLLFENGVFSASELIEINENGLNYNNGNS